MDPKTRVKLRGIGADVAVVTLFAATIPVRPRAGPTAVLVAVWLSIVLATGVVANAQSGGPPSAEQDFDRVEFRVTSVGAGDAIEVDRGTVDGLRIGDIVFLMPRGGGSYRGRVAQVDSRSAIVEMQQAGFLPEVGTRGRARVPASRLEPVTEPVPQPPVVRDPEPGEPSEDKPGDPGRGDGQTQDPDRWSRGDDGWTPDKSLLSLIRPERPRDRGMRVSGRVFTINELTEDEDQGTKNTFSRTGVAFLLENPFSIGGAIQVDAELDYRTERGESRGFDLLPRRLSYRHGGNRFQKQRFEFGRFLQYGAPEFGVLDGAEWGDRTRDGHRYGASIGFLPELDEDFDSGGDLQVAGYFHWVADPSERVSVKAAFQKTFHNGKSDRDLVVIKGHYLPLEDSAWDYHGSIWVDIYGGRDDEKNGGLELTQAYLSARRTWGEEGGIDIDYRRIRFFEGLRNEFLPLAVGELANNRFDRLSADAWLRWTDDTRIRGLVAGWDDEDHDGSALQIGFESRDWLSEGSQTDVTAFASFNEFSNSFGARVSHSEEIEGGSWDILYELTNHHIIGFENNLDDFLQHRLRGGYNIYTPSGWTWSVYGQLHQWDEELTWTIGFQAQRAFRMLQFN